MPDLRADVRVGVDGDLAAQLGARLGDRAADVARLPDSRLEAVLVDFDELAQPRRLADNLAQVVAHARAPRVTEREHVVAMQDVQVHLRALGQRGPLREVVEVHARHHVVAAREHALGERLGLGQRPAHDVGRHHDVVAIERAVEPADVRLAAVQQTHALPLARPDAKVVKELIVAHAGVGERRLREQHVAEVFGRPQQLKPGVAGRQHVLADRRVGVARVERVGMGVAQVLKHGRPPKKKPGQLSRPGTGLLILRGEFPPGGHGADDGVISHAIPHADPPRAPEAVAGHGQQLVGLGALKERVGVRVGRANP